VVAWDNLSAPNPNATNSTTMMPQEQGCKDASQRIIPPLTKPALGMSADYYLPPEPNTTVPVPTAKSLESRAYSAAGIDSGEIVIRGGSHFDFDFIPNAGFGATLRGADEIVWYTDAWMDKYVKGDPDADARLLTNRWRTDGDEAAVDPNADGNDFSFYYLSRLDLHAVDGAKVDCENLRAGCASLVTSDGVTGDFNYLSYDTSPDVPAAAGAPAVASTTVTSATTSTAAGSVASGSTAATPRATRVKPRVITTRATPTQPTRTLAYTGSDDALPLIGLGLVISCALIGKHRRRCGREHHLAQISRIP
jgi:hypothetical protein